MTDTLLVIVIMFLSTGETIRGIDFEHTVLGHAQNIMLQQIRRILLSEVERYMGDVPLFSLARLHLQDKSRYAAPPESSPPT